MMSTNADEQLLQIAMLFYRRLYGKDTEVSTRKLEKIIKQLKEIMK